LLRLPCLLPAVGLLLLAPEELLAGLLHAGLPLLEAADEALQAARRLGRALPEEVAGLPALPLGAPAKHIALLLAAGELGLQLPADAVGAGLLGEALDGLRVGVAEGALDLFFYRSELLLGAADLLAGLLNGFVNLLLRTGVRAQAHILV
jgi:hypothetical protein